MKAKLGSFPVVEFNEMELDRLRALGWRLTRRRKRMKWKSWEIIPMQTGDRRIYLLRNNNRHVFGPCRDLLTLIEEHRLRQYVKLPPHLANPLRDNLDFSTRAEREKVRLAKRNGKRGQNRSAAIFGRGA